MPKKIFNKYYKELNPAQREAVDSIEGPVMVIAGPGTGKTQVLTVRIANILDKTDVNPDNILALTFTDAGVASMRKRLAEIIGTPAYNVNISTFHGFANDVIKKYPDFFPQIISSNIATEIEQIDIFRGIIESSKLKELKPYGDKFYYLKPVISAIRELKREGIEPKQLDDLLKDEERSFNLIEDLYHDKGAYKGKMRSKYQEQLRQLNKNKELAKLYHRYQRELESRRLYDYEDMIMKLLKALQSNKDLLMTLQEQYHYFLIDEHQDTNRAQNKILEILASFHDNPNVFIVGDQRQAIFRFQGASLENFFYFKNLYKNAKLIDLKFNYRSSQTILDSAHSLMQHRVPTPLKSRNNYTEKPIAISAFATEEIERFAIARGIQSKIKSGTSPGDIAVIYRTNKEAKPIADMLSKLGIPFVIESELDVLDDMTIRKLLQLLRAVNEYGDTAALLEALHIDFLGIDPLDIYRIASKRKNPYAIIGNKKEMQKIGLASAKELHSFAGKLRKWHSIAHNDSLVALFESIVRDSGLLESVIAKSDYLETMEKISVLFEQVQALSQNGKNYRLADFMRHIKNLLEHNISIRKAANLFSGKRVHLMTAHKSKGQEFGVVYIVNAADKHWGNRRRFSGIKLPDAIYALANTPPSSRDDTEDERNLFYVALTRAKREVHISYARYKSDGKEQLPSQFIGEIKKGLASEADTASVEREFERSAKVLFGPQKTASGPDIRDKEFLRDLFARRGLAVTHLNNYIECPWKYFYVNLIRIPQAQTTSQMYGIAVHAALKDYFDLLKTGLEPGAVFLSDRFVKYLKKQELSEDSFRDLKDRGMSSLKGYYKNYAGHWNKNVLNEINIRGIELAPNIILTGKIDKIEFLDKMPPKGRIATAKYPVNVVDYKTGKPKSRSYIEGRTKSSAGDYRRQLVFYNILLNEYAGGIYEMKSGEIDFVEPNNSGRYKRERFEILKDEISELEDLIKRVADEILNLKFWNKKCGKKDCEYCRLRGLMK